MRFRWPGPGGAGHLSCWNFQESPSAFFARTSAIDISIGVLDISAATKWYFKNPCIYLMPFVDGNSSEMFVVSLTLDVRTSRSAECRSGVPNRLHRRSARIFRVRLRSAVVVVDFLLDATGSIIYSNIETLEIVAD
jgi:hypothetical protein